jgi:hypothetical protein
MDTDTKLGVGRSWLRHLDRGPTSFGYDKVDMNPQITLHGKFRPIWVDTQVDHYNYLTVKSIDKVWIGRTSASNER